MPRIMYWNCTASGSPVTVFNHDKLELIRNRVAAVNPDVLCLDEVSRLVVDSKTQTTGKQISAQDWQRAYLNDQWDELAVSVNPGVHLNGVVFCRRGASGIACNVGIPDIKFDSENTKRDLLRVTLNSRGSDSYGNPTSKDVFIWFLHANASASSGEIAVKLALAALGGNYAMFVGDFNFPFADPSAADAAAKVKGTAPLIGKMRLTGWTGKKAFTQWTSSDSRLKQGDDSEQIPGLSRWITPNGTIDYALHLKGLNVSPFDSMAGMNDAALTTVFQNFDHFPIAYDVSL